MSSFIIHEDSLIMEGDMTLQHVESAREFFLSALESSPELKLDMSRVTDIDLGFLQLLISLNYSAEKSEKKVILKNIPDELNNLIENAGLINFYDMFST